MEKNQLSQWEELYQSFTEKMNTIKESGNGVIDISQKVMELCLNFLATLKKLVVEHGFSTPEEEINFFKRQKPRFHSQLIFYSKVFNIELKKPIGAKNVIDEYYQKHLLKIRLFFENHIETYQYYRSNSTMLDEQYFLRQHAPAHNVYHHRFPDIDPIFTTDKDYMFSQIIASELLSHFLQDAIAKLHQEAPKPGSTEDERVLLWTDSKVGFVEFVYAAKAKGCFNNGTATLTFLFDKLGKAFGVGNINSSRIFQEIIGRQKGFTVWTDQLKESLLRFIDKIL